MDVIFFVFSSITRISFSKYSILLLFPLTIETETLGDNRLKRLSFLANSLPFLSFISQPTINGVIFMEIVLFNLIIGFEVILVTKKLAFESLY